jgi:hypothetical protein
MPSTFVMPHDHAITAAGQPPSAGHTAVWSAAAAEGRRAGIEAGSALAAILSCDGTRPLTRPGVDECACTAIDAGVKGAIAANVAARLSACMAAVVPYSLLSPAGAKVACEAARRLLPGCADTAYLAVRDQAEQAGLETLAHIPPQVEPGQLAALLDAAVAAAIAATIEPGSRKALRAAVVAGIDIGLRSQTKPSTRQDRASAALPHPVVRS